MNTRLKKYVKKRQINIRIEKSQIDTLKELSIQAGTSVSTSVRLIIEDYLKMYKHVAAKYIAANHLLEVEEPTPLKIEPPFIIEFGTRKPNPNYHGNV